MVTYLRLVRFGYILFSFPPSRCLHKHADSEQVVKRPPDGCVMHPTQLLSRAGLGGLKDPAACGQST